MNDDARSYIKPKSLTWWSGVMLIATGVFLAFAPDHGGHPLITVIAAFAGVGASPALLIGAGAGLIGLRAKTDRIARAVDAGRRDARRAAFPDGFPPRVMEEDYGPFD